MIFPSPVADYAHRVLSSAKASRLIDSASNLDEAIFDGQDLQRITAAMVAIAERGVLIDRIIGLAMRDWRDLLVGGGLGDGDWPVRLAELLESEPQP